MRGFIGAQTNVARLVFPNALCCYNQYQVVGFGHYSRLFLGNAELGIIPLLSSIVQIVMLAGLVLSIAQNYRFAQ